MNTIGNQAVAALASLIDVRVFVAPLGVLKRFLTLV